MRIRLLQLAVLLICLPRCIDRHTNTPAFYVWKSKLSAENTDTAYLNILGVQKIYARMFSVSNKGNGAFPTTDCSPSSGNPDFQQEVVPVVLTTDQTVLQCPTTDIEEFARNCADQVDAVYRSHFSKLPDECQFDCNWTVKTKENYFSFLKHIRRLRKGALVGYTIRLHQIKFKDRTGMPPMDRGTLMYYASSESTNFENKDTILNNKGAASYIKDIGPYPLHLDIVLPLYSWGIVRGPFGQIRLINGIRQATIGAHPEYYKQTKEGIYNILQSHYLGGVWMNKDYELKVEEVSPETLLGAAQPLQRKLRKENREIIFCHLDKEILRQYSTQQLTNAINAFS